MNSLTRIWLLVCCATVVSLSAWELDTASPKTFTPLRVGNEWVYFDSSWLEVSADPLKKVSSDSLVRTVKIIENYTAENMTHWIAAVDVKGVRTIRHPDGAVVQELRDTAFTDTLSMPPNGYFAPSTDNRLVSWGMIALFPWFAFEEPCTSSSAFGITTTIGLENEKFGDSLMRIMGSTHQLYGTEAMHSESEITAMADVGMVYGTRTYYSLANNLYRMNIKIRSFNGKKIDPVQYEAAVSMPVPYSRQHHPVGEMYERILFFGSVVEKRGVRFTLQGRRTTTHSPNASGVMIRKRKIITGK